MHAFQDAALQVCGWTQDRSIHWRANRYAISHKLSHLRSHVAKCARGSCSAISTAYNNNMEDGDACDTHSSSSAASAANSRRRCRTLHMLRYLAAEPSDVAYAAIIEGADDQIIKAIRGVGRAFIQGSLGDLSPVESLALGRYRKSIEGFADDANSMECTRKALLKPRKARRRVPGSAEYVPMLLTLALARGGLETYVDDADGSDVSSLNSGDFEDSHDSSNDDSRHSSAGEDSEDSNNDDNRS